MVLVNLWSSIRKCVTKDPLPCCWQNRPNHPLLHLHRLSGIQTPCRHGFLQCPITATWNWWPISISQWFPSNPSKHRHLLTPLHLPPFMHGMTHLAENQFDFSSINQSQTKATTSSFFILTKFTLWTIKSFCALTFIFLYTFASVQTFWFTDAC